MSRAVDEQSPFHAGERAVQEKLGVRSRAELVGQHMIHDFMPEQHQEFFATLPFVLVGSLDASGRPWASLLAGAPGFLHAPDEEHLDVSAHVMAGDPLATALREQAPLGLLGIQLETRRRNRMNGRVVSLSESGFRLRVDQSFGNCPKYITARVPVPSAREAVEPTVEAALLSAQARATVERADTCFIASASSAHAELADAREGVDVSHRGGNPGFVRVDEVSGQTVLTMPDFSGNDMFNTIGNLVRYPRAGLLFLDFEQGDVLLLTCRTELVYDGAEVRSFEGAQRLTRFRVEAGLFYRAALPFVWSAAVPSPQLVRTGAWSHAAALPLDGVREP